MTKSAFASALRALAISLLAWVAPVGAQAWPVKPVTIWHGLAAGTNPDIIARALQPGLGERLGQPILVDMKPGASGRIATAFVAKQPADGYSLIMLNGGDGVMAATVKDLPYDLLREFTFVSTTTVFPFLLIVPADSPHKTLADFIEDARRRPGKLTYGHSGVASTLHLTGELLREQTGIDITHVPFKGTQAQELAAGRLDMAVSVATSAMPFIRSGKARVLAVTGAQRDPAFPEVPTVGETVPGFEVSSWLGLAVPAKTPQAVVDRLNADVRAVLQREDVAARIRQLGSQPVAMSPDEFRGRVASDIAKWRRLAAKVNLD